MKALLLAVLSAVLGALALYSVGGIVAALIAGAEMNVSIHQITYILVTSGGSVYSFRASRSRADSSLAKGVAVGVPIASLAIAALAITFTFFALETSSGSQSINEEYLSKRADEINRGLPFMIDSQLEAFQVEAEGLNLVNNYRFVNHAVKDMDSSAVIDTMRGAVTGDVCNDSSLRRMLNSGVTVTYRLLDREKTIIGEIRFDRESCREEG